MPTFVSSYEVLSQPLIPDNVNVPYVTQGVFVQISNTNANEPLSIAMQFNYGQPFVANNDPDDPDKATIKLMIEYINENGDSVPYSIDNFLMHQSLQLDIAANSTYILGIQYILGQAILLENLGTTPTNSLASRGQLIISADGLEDNQILVTTRQFFTTYDSSSKVSGMTASAYVNPTFRLFDSR